VTGLKRIPLWKRLRCAFRGHRRANLGTLHGCSIVVCNRCRIRNEAAFASLAGVNPIPASSGNTIRHRLNRGGDRRLNKALHIITVTRMTHDPNTKAYVEKRLAEGRTRRETRRCLIG
jgi:transposase